jgi:hypothetical protein
MEERAIDEKRAEMERQKAVVWDRGWGAVKGAAAWRGRCAARRH